MFGHTDIVWMMRKPYKDRPTLWKTSVIFYTLKMNLVSARVILLYNVNITILIAPFLVLSSSSFVYCQTIYLRGVLRHTVRIFHSHACCQHYLRRKSFFYHHPVFVKDIQFIFARLVMQFGFLMFMKSTCGFSLSSICVSCVISSF